MDQALYDQLSEARRANALDPQDLQDFNTLEQGGEFAPFQGGAPPTTTTLPAQPPAPGGVPGAPPAEATGGTPAEGAPAVGEPIDFTNRPQTDLVPDPNKPFGTETKERMGTLPLSQPGDAYPVPRMIGRAAETGFQAAPAVLGTATHEATGSPTLGNIAQFGSQAVEAAIIHRLLGSPITRMIGTVPSLMRLILGRANQPGAPGAPGAPGTPPPVPGTPPAGAPPPQSQMFTPYPPGNPPTYH
jgi:hypothetical protein